MKPHILASIAVLVAAPAWAAHPLPTNLPDTVTYAGPPAGFDPLRASDAELDTYAFPPRPPLHGAGQARARWEDTMRHARERVMPVLEQTAIAAGPPRQRSRATAGAGGATSINWSGEVIQTNANGYGPGAFVGAVASFNIPIASQAFGACTGGTDRLFTWVGIDGWSLDQVFQAGTESDATCVNGANSTYYAAWYEWYPNYAVRIPSLPVAAGDVMDVLVRAQSATTGIAWIVNATTGKYVILGFNAPPGITLKGDSVEWIQERPTWYGVRATLTNYVAGWMSNTQAQQYGSSVFYTPGTPPAGASVFGVTMLDDQGGAISKVTLLGGTGMVFNDMGSAN